MANKNEDKEILKELREITKTKENWGEVIDDVRLAFVWACENIATNAP